MASTFGEQFRISLFGESHGPAIGLVIDGVPPGEAISMGQITTFLARRAPGTRPWASSRKEPDCPHILAGIYRGKTTGTPIAALIYNEDQRPEDYEEETGLLRPGHADYSGHIRYRGANDPRGGGHFSGRLTAPLCFAGALALQMLKRRRIVAAARISSIGEIKDAALDTAAPPRQLLYSLGNKDFPVLDEEKGRQMRQAIEEAQKAGDSLGGIVQGLLLGLPDGLGDPIFAGMESRLASILYSIPAVKGLSFGDGFAACRRRGSQNNDRFYLDKAGQIRTRSNHEGGINGGLTNGMPLVFNVGIKPTPSLALPQETVNIKTMKAATTATRGRHDPCIVPRAVPVVEAAAAIAILDSMLVAYGRQGFAEMR